MEYNNNSCYLRLRTHYLKYVTDFFFCFPPIQNLVFQSKFYPFKHWIKPISLSVQACLRDKHTHFRIHCEGLSDRKRNVHNISRSGERPRNAPVKQSHCRLRTTALVPLDPKMRQKKTQHNTSFVCMMLCNKSTWFFVPSSLYIHSQPPIIRQDVIPTIVVSIGDEWLFQYVPTYYKNRFRFI